jgi:hypothetical protein
MMKKLLLILPLLFWLGCEEEVEEDTTPPTVSISSHSSGQTVYEIVTITVSTQDNEGISKVEFLINDSLVLTDTESPYEYEWNTTQYEDGSEHIIKVVSYDNSDNSTESQPILLIVDNDGRDPAPVSLLYQTDLYKYTVDLAWSKSIDLDFKQYLIQKADTINAENIFDCIDFDDWPDYSFDESCVDTWSIIHTVNSSDDTTFSDTSVTLANYYVYKITVLDSADLSSDSNIRYYSTRNVESLPITNLNIINELSVEVEWQQSSEDDFIKYELYRYDANDSLLLLTTHNVSEIYYLDENTTEFDSYSYFIRHYDTKLNFADGTSESISVHLSPATLEVPSEYFPSIQSALNAAESSDIVLVNDGIYYENLIFPDKNNVKLKSLNGPDFTIIDGSRNGTVITVRSYDSVMDTTNTIEGFTIQNAGYVDYNTEPDIQWDRDGGGISLEDNANILVKNNVIKDNYNSCGGGGGIYSYESSPIIVNNIFIENVAGISPNGEYCGNWYGGGIMAYFGNPQIINCIFKQNQAQHEGGAIRIYETENTKILNCVFFDNQLIGNWDRGSVIEGYGDSMVVDIINCIFWESNTNPIDSYYTNPTINISYSLTDFNDSDAIFGNGNISGDPLFTDETEFRLNSSSPCINAGNPDIQYNDIDGSRNDVGAYGGPNGDW